MKIEVWQKSQIQQQLQMNIKNIQNKTKYKLKYTKLEKISEGAFGTVYNAINNQTKQQFAIKQIVKSGQKNTVNAPFRQISILSNMNHRNIIKLVQIYESQFKTELVFEKCQYDLNQLINSLEYPISKKLVKHLIYQILLAVNHIHQKKILHRDLKPSNILINNAMVVKICDFGSAVQESDKEMKGQFEIEGFTKWYKAPQILFGSRKYTSEVDIWSLGCVFAQLIVGIPLFCGANQIQQLVKISNLLGSPDIQNWPSIAQLPDYGKIIFHKKNPKSFNQYFDILSEQQIQLLKLMLKYEKRANAKQILQHKYFKGINDIAKQKFEVEWAHKRTEEPYFSYQKLLKQ